MPPKPCPSRLKKLIDRENALSPDKPSPLRQIAKALDARRRNQGTETFAVQTPSEVTINLTDCAVSVRNDLADALDDVYSPDMLDLIRICPIVPCGRVFWAGRDDRWACSRHVERWQKRESRRRIKERQAQTHAERAQADLQKTIGKLSKTAVAVIRVIMADRRRRFESIDSWALYYLRDLVIKVPSRFIVRQSLTKLAKEGYLTYRPDIDDDEDQYEPTEKLVTLWAEMQKGDAARFKE